MEIAHSRKCSQKHHTKGQWVGENSAGGSSCHQAVLSLIPGLIEEGEKYPPPPPLPPTRASCPLKTHAYMYAYTHTHKYTSNSLYDQAGVNSTEVHLHLSPERWDAEKKINS